MFSVFGLSEQAYRCRMPEPVEAILHNLSVNEALTVLWGLNATDRAQFPTNYPDQCYHRQSNLIQLAHSNKTDWTNWSADKLTELASGQPARCESGYVYEMLSNQVCYAIRSSTLLQIFRSKVHLKRLFLTSVIYLCHIYSTFGIILYGNRVRGSIYVVAVVNASTALPGTFLSCILYRVFRWRKRPLLAVFSFAFLSTLLGALVTLVWKTETDRFLMITEFIALALLEAALDMIYIYIPELFPTVLRSKSLGFCAGCARLGAAVCSFTNQLDGMLGHGSPMVFYAASIFVATLAVLMLSDTTGENLDQCLESQNATID
ncbi:hypothetical protein FBUS_03577 [Fasciolopsis buskii]|uniref:Major facilitator superfamily (MFS) profile domain-containing protein n=1 Tax=Fasciolopsis buskii TaxID=27845 RepID=A0A8E0S0Q4_9TREM|nr:hypothetical protein FBUS_03577 [Fasciolopsis buski]